MLLDLGHHDDPPEFLLAAMNDSRIDLRVRVDAAKGLLRHGEVGKKEELQNAAKKASSAKFAAAAPLLSIVRQTTIARVQPTMSHPAIAT